MKLHERPDDDGARRDEQVFLFPSLVYQDAKRGCWKAIVQGRVCDVGRVPMTTRLMINGLKRALGASSEEFAGDIFQQRIRGFAAKPIAGRRIAVEIGGQHFLLRRKSKRNGTFLGVCRLHSDTVAHFENQGDAEQQLRVRLVSAGTTVPQPPALESVLHIVPPRGISIVSDIDDTIKATDVTSKRSMLENTFLKPFAVIEGMSDLYRQWHAAGATFHYVSSSPWQLFQPLAELCELHGFPAGSMHLRYFRIRDEMFKRWRPGRRKGKAAIIAGLMTKLPQRKFILVGDSGERDAEIYRFLAQKFPDQVQAILIRHLEAKPLSEQRLARLKRQRSQAAVHVFRDASELQSLSEQLLKLP